MINKVILIGNVGADPEVKSVGESKVAQLNLATSGTFKNRQGEKETKTEWHKVVFWSKQAEIIEQYVKKGMKLYIEGKLEYRSYEKDGNKMYFTQIKGSEFRFLDSKSEQKSEPNFDKGDDLPFN